ncbi:MAG: hypothetical protein DBX39_01095 [Bacillota bacterium]|nr:MAG: hypothetical protein DBX39_01095 [Bacillota bacterium]
MPPRRYYLLFLPKTADLVIFILLYFPKKVNTFPVIFSTRVHFLFPLHFFEKILVPPPFPTCKDLKKNTIYCIIFHIFI